MSVRKTIKALRVRPGSKISLKDYETDWADTDELRQLSKDQVKEKTKKLLQKNIERLAQAQELLYASDNWSVLVILQAMDAAGKDGTIKHVMSGLNPQGCQVYSFKQPSKEELDHNFLWRHMKSLPERGRIGIFNRSYYEDVLVVRVHPELLAHGQLPRLPRGDDDRKFWARRFQDINTFERHLVRNGTIIVKFFLHVSKKEQKRRFVERLENPDKHWKFSAADLGERRHWDQYMEAYEEAISATSTKWAPWYVIPADQKWVTRCIVADILTKTIRDLDLKYPSISAQEKQAIDEAMKKLAAE